MIAGIIDSTKVTRVELQNAASITGLMVTTDGVRDPGEGEGPPMPPGGGGMGDMY